VSPAAGCLGKHRSLPLAGLIQRVPDIQLKAKPKLWGRARQRQRF